MTELQKKMITKIARSEYTVINGSMPESIDDIGYIWAEAIIETPEDKGVFTSLLKEKLVFHNKMEGDAVCGLTDRGYAAFCNI